MSSTTPTASEHAPDPQRPSVLFVDDEACLVDLERYRLEELGYRVTATTDPLEALALFRATPDAFDLVITDRNMPELLGTDLALELTRLRPDLPIVLSSGLLPGPDTPGITATLAKPYAFPQLVTVVQRALGVTEPVR
jgi:CheY-like chemotaxis protein